MGGAELPRTRAASIGGRRSTATTGRRGTRRARVSRTRVNFNGHMGLKNNWDVHLGSTFGKLTRELLRSLHARRSGCCASRVGFFPWGGFNTDSRRIVSGGMWVNLSFCDEGKSHGWSLSPYVNFRLSTQFQLNVGPNILARPQRLAVVRQLHRRCAASRTTRSRISTSARSR